MAESLYVCRFSSGHIKVGRSIDPMSRIAAHADRLACIGVELVNHFVVACVGPSEPREAHLIARCADAADKRYHYEWFEGLDYRMACEWAEIAAQMAVDTHRLAPAADVALIAELGGPRAVADLLGYGDGGAQRVTNWLARRSGIPASVKLEFPHVFLRHLLPASA
jgi:hypothetical protein